ncbi:ABC transporter permease [Phycicoccus sp. CSK15P-2]|uniref:ABC transporter permease n=1 Tax=Phycicoccus sp. CSK15P-2 TaxID=2807627 RepID=UPI00194F981C|nr:ABC transporter permease [Phycicoccus sp. CSK15P-2]MBM6405232.1 ABC transporter permease [Phycicoccus sp. CSK15P-2]
MVDETLRAEGDIGEARSLTQDAWRQLRRSPLFWVSAAMITVFVLMAVAPSLFTSLDPAKGDLSRSRETPNAAAWFGRDLQGYDIFARCIYGARASILVGVFATLGTSVVGSVTGMLAGYFGGLADTLISRIGDIFFAIPLLLGAIVFLSSFRGDDPGYFQVVFQVVLVLVVFGWPSIMRLMRSSVLQIKPNDYVSAARALGASPVRILRSHVFPNAVAPVIVVSTINLGVYIAVEATLSFLGIGLIPPTISWGVMVSDGLPLLRASPHVLLFPAVFLSLAVLAFIMFGDAVRDAFDPKSR